MAGKGTFCVRKKRDYTKVSLIRISDGVSPMRKTYSYLNLWIILSKKIKL